MIRKWCWLLILVATASLAGERSPLMEEYNGAWLAVGQLRYGDDVVTTLKGIIEKDKTFYRAYRLLAEVYTRRHEAAAGKLYFEALTERDPSNELAHYGLGDVLRLSGDSLVANTEYRICALKNSRSLACQDRLREYGFLTEPDPNQASLDYFNRLRQANPRNPVIVLEVVIALGEAQQYEKQGELLEEALRMAREDRDLELEAWILTNLASWTQQTGRGYLQAIQLDSQALAAFEALGDVEQQYDCRRSIAWLRAVSGEYDDAIASLQTILGEAVALKHIGEQSRAHASIALTYSRGGELNEAIKHYRKSDELRMQTGLNEKFQSYIAALYARQGDYRTAIEKAHEEVDRQETENQLFLKAHSLRNLGVWYSELGEYAKSLDYSWRSIKLFQQLGYVHVANAGIGNLSEIYASLGDYSKAEHYTTIALTSAHQHQDASEIQGNLGRLADIYFKKGEPQKALPLWDQALAMAPAVGLPSFDATIYLSRCLYYERIGNYELALRDADAGLVIERRISRKPDLAYALNREGFLHLKLGRPQEAVKFFHEALDIGESAGLREITWEARQGLGEIAVQQNRLPEAMDYFRKAISDIEAIRGQNLAPDLKVNFFQDRLAVYQAAIAVLQRLHAADPTHGYDREAFRIAEQSRARAFLDGLAESKTRIARELSPEQRKRELQLTAAVSQANVRLMYKNSSANQAALKQAEQALSDWTLELRNTNPRYQSLRYPDPYSVEQVRKELLRNGEALVEYFTGDANLFAWVVTKSSSNMVKLLTIPRMNRLVREYRGLLSHHPTGEAALTNYRDLSKRLHSALLAPLLSRTGGADRLVIVPDGILFYLPFETLLSPRDRFVVEDYMVSYVPSASAAGSLRREVRPGGSRRLELLAFGDPTFERTVNAPAAELVRSAMESKGWKFAPLPNTRTEVNGIAALYPARASVVHLGKNASENNLKDDDLSRYKRIHFATHAVLDEENPLRSGIVLSLPGAKGEDGILQPREIMDLDIRANLVVLSACETALGKTVRGEGMVGLTRAFFYAGVPLLVVSQWKVSDIGTAELMKSFYRQMQQGKDASRALRDAKIEMMHSGGASYAHPYYWAPFILAGMN